MKKLMATALLLTSVASSGVWAHGSHGVVGEDAAKASAARAVQKMTFQDIGFEAGKLDESWQSLKADQIKLYSLEPLYRSVKWLNLSQNYLSAYNIFWRIIV